MAYVSRDGQGQITGVFANPQASATEFIADNDPALMSFIQAPFLLDGVDKLDVITLKVSFNHENRIRALESKAPVTLAQFKTALRAL